MANEKQMDKTQTITYPAAHILLELARDEYTKEKERANALDGKASFFITVIVAVATIFVPIIPFSKIMGVFVSGECWQKCLTSVLILGLVVAFSFLIAAFKHLYDAYKLTDYMRPDIKALTDNSIHTAAEDETCRGLCTHYKTIVDDNVKVNEKKCKSISNGLRLCGIGFLILTASTICLQIIAGG